MIYQILTKLCLNTGLLLTYVQEMKGMGFVNRSRNKSDETGADTFTTIN
jgi:hypothetical protein